MKVNRSMLMAACAACLMTGLAAERRMAYPDFMRRWPQLKGVMLGSSTEKDFQDLRDMGATLARYQMHGQWNWFTNSTDDVAAFNAWMDKHLDHLAEMLPWARKYGIKICVDQHTHIGGLTKEKYNSDMIFVEKKYEDALVASWEKIARRFKGNLDVIYGYDLFNEPINRENALVKRSWHDVFCRVIEAIRAIDPDTPIIVEPNCNASPRGFDIKNPYGLKGVDLLPYENLIYTVHVYVPMGYTHQGLFQKKENYKPIPYPASNAKLDPNRKRYPGDMGDDPKEAELWDKQYVREAIQSVRDFQLRHGVRIFVGEFSAAAYAPGAEKYIEDLCDLFHEYGWDWTYHAFRESTCWSFEHEGASFFELKPAKGETSRKKVIKAAWAKNAKAGESFRWTLNGTGKTERREVTRVPESGTYSVRFRAALMNARGGNFRVFADGVAFQSHGDGFYLDGSSVQQLVPGQADETNFDFTLRNDAIKFAARRLTNGVTRVIAVNIENRPNAAKWTLPSAPKAAKALVGKGPDKVVGPTIEDAFGPLERRVYDISL